MKYFRESSIVTYRGEMIASSLGTPGSVEFDFEAVWKFKRLQNKFDPYYLDFFHVHPPGFGSLSSLDVECMKGFDLAFGRGKLFSFSIVLFHNETLENSTIRTFSLFHSKDNIVSEELPVEIKPEYLSWLFLSSHNNLEVVN